jgi:hypothetical protein
MIVIFVTRERAIGCLSSTKGPNRRNYSSLFSTQLYPINVANFPNCCNITQTFMVASENDVRQSRRHAGNDCLQRIRILNCSVHLFSCYVTGFAS